MAEVTQPATCSGCVGTNTASRLAANQRRSNPWRSLRTTGRFEWAIGRSCESFRNKAIGGTRPFRPCTRISDPRSFFSGLVAPEYLFAASDAAHAVPQETKQTLVHW